MSALAHEWTPRAFVPDLASDTGVISCPFTAQTEILTRFNLNLNVTTHTQCTDWKMHVNLLSFQPFQASQAINTDLEYLIGNQFTPKEKRCLEFQNLSTKDSWRTSVEVQWFRTHASKAGSTQVPSLAGELTSHTPWDVDKKYSWRVCQRWYGH